ncbi:hypothetical protein D3C83_159730 [compost metagenome]
MRIYEAGGAPALALAPYDETMSDKGWTTIASDERHRVYRKADIDLIVTATADAVGSTVSLVEMTAK